MVLAEWRNEEGVLNAAGRRRRDEAGAGRMVFDEWRNEEGMTNAVGRRRHEEGAGWMAFAEGRRDTNTQQTCGARLSRLGPPPRSPASFRLRCSMDVHDAHFDDNANIRPSMLQCHHQ